MSTYVTRSAQSVAAILGNVIINRAKWIGSSRSALEDFGEIRGLSLFRVWVLSVDDLYNKVFPVLRSVHRLRRWISFTLFVQLIASIDRSIDPVSNQTDAQCPSR